MFDLLFKKIEDFVKKENLISPESTIIIGLSGGPDSVFLLYFLNSLASKLNLSLIAAHLNHEWRDDAWQDELFCKNLCKELGVKFVSKKASEIELQKKYNGSKEELGRILRRAFFEKLKKDYSAQLIALAHHKDDQIETFFIRLIRGATISGLSSIRAKQGDYIRPLLQITKYEIINYLEDNNIKYLTDPTNVSNIFLRNRIRNILIPALNSCDKRAENGVFKTVCSLQKTENFIEKYGQSEFNKIFEANKLDLKKLFSLDDFIQERVIIIWLLHEKVPFVPTEAFFKEIKKFLLSVKSQKHSLHTNWYIHKIKGFAVIKMA